MTKTLTKADIVDSLYTESALSRTQARETIEKLIELMSHAIKKDNNLLLSGFGAFECYHKDARRGRNPQTGESIKLEERNVVVYRLSKKFREMLNKPGKIYENS